VRSRNRREARAAEPWEDGQGSSAYRGRRTDEVDERGRGTAEEGRPRRRRGLLRVLLEIVIIVGAAFAIAMLVQAFLLKPFTVHQESMEPTLLEGDRILLSRLTYHFRGPKVGDVVVFDSPLNESEDLVKRVVGVAGDRVAVADGDLYVNGVPMMEPYLFDQDFTGTMPEQIVPEGHVFVMGDNRDVSGDSRSFGAISTERIIGEALCTYWPIGRWSRL
jgi:signal peptidase I